MEPLLWAWGAFSAAGAVLCCAAGLMIRDLKSCRRGGGSTNSGPAGGIHGGPDQVRRSNREGDSERKQPLGN